MGDGEIKLDPLCELFRTGDPDGRTYSTLNRCFMTGGFVAIGVGSVLLGNSIVRRPVWSALHRHVMAGTAGFIVGELATKYTRRVAAEKDLHYYHYMTLHPEDFPPPKKIKFRDYLEPWIPIR